MATIDVSEAKGVRYLHFGSPWIQGAMRIARPHALELEYTRDLMLPLLVRPPPWPATVLQVGLGAASVTRFLRRARPEARLTVVEIDARVVDAARQFFKLPEECAHLRLAIAEGHEWLAGTSRKFDFVIVDGFDERGRPGALDTKAFHLNVCSHLTRTGIVAVNLLARHRGAKPSIERLREAYEGRIQVVPPCESGNVVVLATAGDEVAANFTELRAAALALREASGLDLRPALARIALAKRKPEDLIAF